MEKESNTSGLSICFILTIVLTVLKLTNTISWSWWIVLAPIWIPCVLYVALILFALLVIVAVSIIDVLHD